MPKQKSAQQVVFVASIPDIKTAIGISGKGDGRLILDIPQTELAEVVKLTLLSNKALKVTVEELDSQVKIHAGDSQA